MGKFIQKSVPTTENQILFLKWFSTRIFRLNRHELKRVRALVQARSLRARARIQARSLKARTRKIFRTLI